VADLVVEVVPKRRTVANYSAVMSEKWQESPGNVGNARAMKSVVQQCLTSICRPSTPAARP